MSRFKATIAVLQKCSHLLANNIVDWDSFDDFLSELV